MAHKSPFYLFFPQNLTLPENLAFILVISIIIPDIPQHRSFFSLSIAIFKALFTSESIHILRYSQTLGRQVIEYSFLAQSVPTATTLGILSYTQHTSPSRYRHIFTNDALQTYCLLDLVFRGFFLTFVYICINFCIECKMHQRKNIKFIVREYDYAVRERTHRIHRAHSASKLVHEMRNAHAHVYRKIYRA